MQQELQEVVLVALEVLVVDPVQHLHEVLGVVGPHGAATVLRELAQLVRDDQHVPRLYKRGVQLLQDLMCDLRHQQLHALVRALQQLDEEVHDSAFIIGRTFPAFPRSGCRTP